MNILFFLKPKSEVAFIYDYSTLRQVLETMEYHKYASIPMLNKKGEYTGTITEGDLLWGIKKYTNLNLKEAENIFIPVSYTHLVETAGSDVRRTGWDACLIPGQRASAATSGCRHSRIPVWTLLFIISESEKRTSCSRGISLISV